MANLSIQSIKRYTSSYVMNVFGLSFTFAAVIIISSLLYYELTFNRSFPEADRIYVGATSDGVNWFCRPEANEIFSKVSEIEYGSLYQEFGGFLKVKKNNGELEGISVEVAGVYKDFIRIFGMEIVEGDTSAMRDIGDLLIPVSIAERYFPGESAVGKTFLTEGNREWTVVGVYRDFPENISLCRGIYTLISAKENINNWSNFNYNLFVKMIPGASVKAAEEKINKMTTAFYKEELPENDKYKFVCIKESYFRLYGGSEMLVYSLLSVVVVLLLIAGINFVNIFVALVPRKVKPVNIVKIFGASNALLRGEQIVEGVLVSLFSFVLGTVLVYFYLMQFPDTMTVFINPLLSYGLTGLFAVILGVIVSLYPAWYLTSFPPMIILSGNFALSPKGRRLRFGLITFQYIASFILILFALMINIQYRYMLGKDKGYNTSQVAVFKVSLPLANQREVIEQKLLANSNISEVTQSDLLFGAVSGTMGWGRSYSKGDFSVDVFPVSYNFLDFMGIKVDSGRTFIKSDELSENGYFIMNRNAMDKFQFEPGEWLNGHRDSTQIVGVVPNLNYFDLRQPVGTMCFYQYGAHPWRELQWYYVKINNNVPASIDHIRNVIAELDPVYPLDVELFDKKFEKLYQKEERFMGFITQFCMLSIIISLVGVFGLVRYDAQFKQREIAIRKVNGATVRNVLFSFCKTYLIIILIAFVIAAPIAWYIIDYWISGFMFKAPIPVWIFVASLLFIAAMTAVLIIIQTYRTATLNPANIVRKN